MAAPRRRRAPRLQRLGGPNPAAGFSYFHGYDAPLAEMPAFTHINEAACTASHVLSPHAHTHLEIVYFLAGRAEWRTAGERYQLKAGDFYLSRPGEIHQGLPDPRDPNHNFAVGFDPGQLPLPLTGSTRRLAGPQGPAPSEVGAALAETCALQFGADAPFQRVVHGGPGIETIYRRILGELDHLDTHHRARRALTVAMIQALLVELLVTVTRCSILGLEDHLAARKPPPRAAFRQLLGWLGTRLSLPPSLGEMAERVGLSATHFAVAFKREIGETPLEHLTSLRLDAAALRLRQGASVTAAAVDLGFSSPQYFSLVFKKRFGASPSSWQRAHVG